MQQRHEKIIRLKHPFRYSVNIDRLKKDILELSRIGLNSEDNGIYRIAFSDADMEGRRWLQERIKGAGMTPYMDGAANVFGSFEKDESNKNPSVLVGSHLDSVPCGGPLDGALGVLAGLECMRVIREKNIKTKYPIELVAFSDEEGRFGGMFGVQALSGNLTPEDILSATDVNGVRLTEVMQAQGLEPMDALDARRSAESMEAYLELHIEQGPVLEHDGMQIGIVEGMSGMFKWLVRLIGTANHSGTTPMHLRNDAFMGLAEFASELTRVLDENGSEMSRATIGKVELEPGFPHTIPGRAEFTLVVRDMTSEILDELHDAYRKALSAIARKQALMFEFDIISRIEPALCNKQILKCIEQVAQRAKVKYLYMPSGAGHDAQFLAPRIKTGMLFVPSKDGKSHSPAEWTDWIDIETGANVLLNALIDSAQEVTQTASSGS